MQRYAGWCMVAYYHMSYKEMKREVEKQIKHDSNYLWIGHNNPGEVDKDAPECALFYGVYEAYIDKNNPKHDDSIEIINAQIRLLDVCRELGVQVTLPIGYQIMMGKSWNEKNKNELRIDINGNLLWHGGYSASFYSEIYRNDIIAYYKWLNNNFIKKYSDVIHLINLADEPKAEDFSSHAETVFKEKYGTSFKESLNNSQGQLKLAKFQSDYIANYAKWSAEQWLKINPIIKTTMTFCGYGAREDALFPTIEKLFSKTPTSFSITFDMYPRDGTYTHYLSEDDITGLCVVTRQLGYLSQKYHKPLWLWSSANSWGLSQDSPVRSCISDSLANQYYLAILASDCTDFLEGICVWNYNIKGQGLYNDTRNTSYNVDDMFAKVSSTFNDLREIMEKSINSDYNVLLYSPTCERYNNSTINFSNPVERVVMNIPYDYVLPVRYKRQEALAKDDVKFAVVDDLESVDLDKIKIMISEISTGGFIWKNDINIISDFVKKGGTYITGVNVISIDSKLKLNEICNSKINGIKTEYKYSRVIFQVEGLTGQEMYVYGDDDIILNDLSEDALIIASNEKGEPVIALEKVERGNVCHIAPDRRKMETIINRNTYKLFVEWMLGKSGIKCVSNRDYSMTCSECTLLYSLNPIMAFAGVSQEKELDYIRSYSIKRDGRINKEVITGKLFIENEKYHLISQVTGEMSFLWWK